MNDRIDADETLRAHARDHIEADLELLAGRDDGWRSSFERVTDRARWQLRRQGLAQMCAVLEQRSEDGGRDESPEGALLARLEGWLCRSDERAPYTCIKGLLNTVMHRPQREYKEAVRQADIYIETLQRALKR